MHNLLLGTAKHMLSVWTSTGILDKTHYLSIQEKVDSFVTPPGIGRIPAKIATGFSSFTAEQWRNWTLIYSLCALKDVIPNQHYDCWLLFVKATNILCRRQITRSEVEEGDSFLMEFCQVFDHLYGKDHYTINLHLHGHIKECILDYGPVYSFWLFAFERLNGILGSYHTNCHDISLQLMRRFLSTTQHGIHNWPTEFRQQLSSLVTDHQYKKGSLHASSIEQALQVHKHEHITPLPPVREAAWTLQQKCILHDLISSVIQHDDFSLFTLYDKATALSIGGFVIGSATSRFVTKALVMATHPRYPSKLFLAKIESFAKMNFQDKKLEGSEVTTLWVACASFYDEHDYKSWFGGPTQVWTRSIFDVQYICLSSIKCEVAICETEVNFGGVIGKQNVYVVSLLSNISV